LALVLAASVLFWSLLATPGQLSPLSGQKSPSESTQPASGGEVLQGGVGVAVCVYVGQPASGFEV
jgi:hypothetical protein